MDNAIINKIASIERCVKRAQEEYEGAGDNFDADFTKQDAAILNLLRACEQSIDLANHIIKIKKLGVPQSSRESFSLLSQGGLITSEQEKTLKAMVGFRNIAVHNYTKLDVNVIRTIIRDHLGDLKSFCQTVLKMSE